METTNHASGLGEAFASYQPTSMSPAQWDRFREDAVELVLRLDHRDAEAARVCMSRLVVFLADQSSNRPEARLAHLLTPTQVEGYLERCLVAGEALGTVENRQGTLNTLLAVLAGQPPPRRSRRAKKPHLEPYATAELLRVMQAVATNGSEPSLGLARTLLCGLTGEAPPTGNEPVRVDVTGRVVTVGDFRWEAPAGMALPPSGLLDGPTVDKARKWGRHQLGFALDRRRLELTYITRLVETLPGLVAVQLPGVGRDRLSAAVQAASRPSAHLRAALLRGPRGPSTSHGQRT